MRMSRVEGILAVSKNNVIGQGDKIPWYHHGDFARFKSITLGNGVLMGYPTFIGMANTYTKLGRQVLPNRQLFVVGRAPFDFPLDVDFSNVEFLSTYGPQDDVETALGFLSPTQKLFIAGGGRVYRDYLHLADRIHLTRIEISCPVDHNTVFLSQETQNLLSSVVYWRSITENGEEISDGLKANYYTFDAVI